MRLIAAVALFVVALLRRRAFAYDPAGQLEVTVEGDAAGGPSGDTLELLSWNVGYGALGGDSDFLADGGRHLRPRSRAAVERNLGAIARLLAAAPDTVLLQEVSRAAWITHRVDVLDHVAKTLAGHARAFAPTLNVGSLPLVGALELGQATFARAGISRAVRHALPSPKVAGVRVQNFNVLESRLRSTGGGPWVVFNVHLPAFDDGSLRRRQLVEILELLQAEYEAGGHVVAGGDWNLRLADTSFPYTTAEKNKAWVRDLPPGVTPAGWTWVVDATRPTNRTLEQPYRAGVNYTSVIDGFLVSPNVEVLDVTTIDLGFAHSDHNPVRATLRKRLGPPGGAAA